MLEVLPMEICSHINEISVAENLQKLKDLITVAAGDPRTTRN